MGYTWSTERFAFAPVQQQVVFQFCIMHCIIIADRFYTTRSDGVLASDWLQELVDGSLPDSVDCGGDKKDVAACQVGVDLR